MTTASVSAVHSFMSHVDELLELLEASELDITHQRIDAELPKPYFGHLGKVKIELVNQQGLFVSSKQGTEHFHTHGRK